MRIVLRALMWAIFLCGWANAATITYQVLDLGGSDYRITYSVEDINFLANQDLEFQFDRSLYSSLSNPVVPAGFDGLPLPPDSLFDGIFSVLALTDIPAPSGPFSIDVSMLGGNSPTSQSFTIYQLDSQGRVEYTVNTGVTQASGVPEPGTFGLVGAVLLVTSFFLAIVRRSRRTT